MNRLRGGLNSLLKIIYPTPPIGGLEINDSVIRLAKFKKGNPAIRAYRLPKGVVEGGRIKDKARLAAVLKELARSSGDERKMGLVLTIPSGSVFIQTINLPPLAARNLEEAAELNLQMVSPLRQGEFYYDWQRVRRGEIDGGTIELLGAFVSREIVKEFSNCLEEAGFSLIAVEFASLSLVRELVRKKFIELGKPYLVAEVMPDGVAFMLVFSGQLLFHSFQNWGDGQGQESPVKVTDFLTTLTQEVANISHFYSAHWGGVISNLIFISSGLENEIKGAFKDKSLSFLKPEEAVPALGAASRPILGSKEINLLGTSSLEIFKQERAITFVVLWRTVLISTLSFLLLLSLGSDLFLRQLAERTMEVNALTLNEPGHQELLALKEKAAKFNELVATTLGARRGSSQIGRIAGLISNLAGVEIRITRVYVPSVDASITVNGLAVNEQAAVAFKNRLAGEKSITEVDLPISGIIPATGGQVSFTVYLRVANSNLPE